MKLLPRRAPRASAREDMLLEDCVAAKFGRVLPHGLARAIGLELAIVHALFERSRAEVVAPRGGDAAARLTGYMATSPMKLIVLAYPLLLLGDTLVVHALVPSRWGALHVVLIVISLYSYVWLIGLYRTMTLRPHALDQGAFHAHKGILGSATMDLANIDAVESLPESAVRTLPRRGENSVARLDVAGSPRVLITLREAVVCKRYFGPAVSSRRVLVSADDASALCDQLHRASRPRA